MPTLPVFNAQRNIEAKTVAPMRNEASVYSQNEQKIIGTVENIAKQWSDAHDVMQYTDAKAKYEVASADIHTRAYQDPDFNNSEKYFKELDDAKERSLQGISNQQVANKLRLDLETDNQISAIKIGAQFKAKQLDHNKVQLATDLSALQQKKITASTAVEANKYSEEANKLIVANLAAGTLTEAEAQKLKYETVKNSFENLVYSNPQAGLAALKNDTSLTPEDRYNLIDNANQIEKKKKDYADWQLSQTQTQSTIDLSDALINNTLTPMMVRNLQQSGMIDAETAAIFDGIALKKNYEIPESTSLAEPDYFLRLIEDSAGDKTQVKKVMTDAAKAYSDHKIGTNQYLYFIQHAKESFERQGKGLFTMSGMQKKLMGAVDGIKEFFKNIGKDKSKSEKDYKETINEFSERIKPGEDVEKIKDDVLNEYRIKTKPEIKSFPSEGKLMIDRNGNKALVYPDGRVEEVR